MNSLSRRQFLVFMGAGVAVIAGSTAMTVRQFALHGQQNTLKFRAITGLPGKPMPSYASYVIDGNVNISNSSGAITKNVFAGSPEETTTIALLTRNVRVTGVQQQRGKWRITGVLTHPEQVQAGEETTFTILLDPTHNVAQTTFFGSPIQLTLENLSLPS